jgi:hypothetical protein
MLHSKAGLEQLFYLQDAGRIWPMTCTSTSTSTTGSLLLTNPCCLVSMTAAVRLPLPYTGMVFETGQLVAASHDMVVVLQLLQAAGPKPNVTQVGEEVFMLPTEAHPSICQARGLPSSLYAI